MRFDIDRLKEIIDTLARNRSRTLLTGFGIFWGIFMLLLMLGAGNGLKTILNKNFEGFTSNAVIVGAMPTSKPYGGFKRDRQWEMDLSDIEAIRLLISEAGSRPQNLKASSVTRTTSRPSSSLIGEGIPFTASS